MRINKACLFLSAVLVGAIPLSAPNAVAMSPETLNDNASKDTCGKKALGKSKTARKTQEVDNTSRKLALSIPGLGTANISLTPAVSNSAKTSKSSAKAPDYPYAISRSGNSITVRVPETVDEAFDYAHVASKQVGKLANEGGTQLTNLAKWIGIYIKQLSHSTTVTPAGYPYINTPPVQAPTQIAAGHKLYLTTEGRLKTVVQR
ncbi:hypothetical protein KBI23_21210 [bacterium]|nr:hypothetical protein [bacterium]MBP9807985.1 hypothetical protein [bacterium]